MPELLIHSVEILRASALGADRTKPKTVTHTARKLNTLYNALDLYVVSSRCEGGPQAIFECAYLKVPIISTRVGQHRFLSESCKYKTDQLIDVNMLQNAYNSTESNFKNIKNLLDVHHIKEYDKYIEELLK